MNSNVSISNPKDPSIKSMTRSAIFAISIMEGKSFEHSMNVNLLVFEETTVIGPLISEIECFVYLFIKLFIRVVFPTPGGPTMAITTGGGGGVPSNSEGVMAFPVEGSRVEMIFLSEGVRLGRGT